MRDESLRWFTIAVLLWALPALAILVASDILGMSFEGTHVLRLRATFATLNTVSLLLAAGHLNYGSSWLQGIREKRGKLVLLGVSVVVLVCDLTLPANTGLFENKLKWAVIPELGFTFFCLTVLSNSLQVSFSERKHLGLKWLAWIPLVFLALAQLQEGPVDRWWVLEVVGLAGKTGFVSLFLALAFSWAMVRAQAPPYPRRWLHITRPDDGQEVCVFHNLIDHEPQPTASKIPKSKPARLSPVLAEALAKFVHALDKSPGVHQGQSRDAKHDSVTYSDISRIAKAFGVETDTLFGHKGTKAALLRYLAIPAKNITGKEHLPALHHSPGDQP